MNRKCAAIGILLSLTILLLGISERCLAEVVAGMQAQAPAGAIAKSIGKIKSVNGAAIILEPSSGPELAVTVQPGARIVRLAPGDKDLKNATPLQVQDLQVGDMVRVRGAGSDGGNSIAALEVVVITPSAVAAAGDQVRQDWQKRGIGGIVQSVDESSGTVNISIPRPGEKRDIVVHTSKSTVIRRYAVDSVKPENAKASALRDIHPGDQLRARGNRSNDGSELNAEEIFAGVFPQFSGTVKSVDASAGTLSVQDLVSKKTIDLKITAESQLHKIPTEMAQGFAMRLKTMMAQGVAGLPGNGPGKDSSPAAVNGRPPEGGAGGRMGGGAMRSGAGDLQQIVSRLPAASLSDLHLQKGDAVVVLSTEGSTASPRTAITVLSGVEPILQAAPRASQAMMLTPWSLGGAPGGDASQ
jgi:hypothetical protein